MRRLLNAFMLWTPWTEASDDFFWNPDTAGPARPTDRSARIGPLLFSSLSIQATESAGGTDRLAMGGHCRSHAGM
ncbi:MAG: hypothetical protein KAU31_00880, partial [Spirochaetaceae bacterium]|nr:hypothetical protein [Spirochaetaceae bacterium]